MRAPIPEDKRQRLENDPFMRVCIIFYLTDDPCEGCIQWNHGFTYGGVRQSELPFIVPMCEKHHRQEAKFRRFIRAVMRERIVYFKWEDEFRAKYPKSDLL